MTDNGCGIEREQLPTAFLRHATSKIEDADDLNHIASLGFRGEALSSIAAVSRVEIITKRKENLTGTRMVLEGAKEQSIDEIGAPDGTTFLMRNLFFNTPVRRKFLKQPATEGSYITDLMEHLALSRPDISFKFVLGIRPDSIPPEMVTCGKSSTGSTAERSPRSWYRSRWKKTVLRLRGIWANRYWCVPTAILRSILSTVVLSAAV